MNTINKVPPFKGWVIQNFPFIEADFDAITEYQLLCKVVEYLNKVIANENQLSESMNYVLNYFNNLDVQDEIDNKLDEMAESGELTEIIAQYLELAGLLCFNTKSDMKAAQNLANGSYVKTFGTTTYNDGYGQFYKIRTLTSGDTIDDTNIIALTNYPTLIAELIKNNDIINLQTGVSNLQTRVTNLEAKKDMVIIGDSYSSRTYLDSNYDLWCERVAETLNLTLHNFADPGAGFLADGDERNSTFSSQINEAYSDNTFDNDNVEYLFIYGGTNDLRYYPTSNVKSVYINAYNSTLENARNKFPNAKIIFLGSNSFLNMYYKAMEDGENITELWIDYNVKNSINFKEYNIVSIDLTLFYLGMNDFYTNGISGHPNYIGHRQFADAVINGLTSSSNAFKHLITATPEVDSSSSSIWSVSNTLAGSNIYQLRITDKEVDLYLSSCITRNASSGNMLLKLPFNIRIPYSTLNTNYFVPANHFANVLCFNENHNTGGIIDTSHNLIEIRYGYDTIRMYNNLKNSNALSYDLIFETRFSI